jgi:surfeit locus 1 family protein
MDFRPYPVLTLIAVPALVALVWLGVWQVQRAEWKTGLIADFERASSAQPQSPESALCGVDAAIGKVTTPPGDLARSKALRVFGHNAAGDAGWRLFQPMALSCGAVLAETGFEALEIGGPGGVPPLKPDQAVTRFYVEPWPEKPMMAAENSPTRNEWHWFDATLMATAIPVTPLNARYIVVPIAGTPDYLTRTPPEGHIGYAVTWFGMAIAFVVIYALFHARAGRLRFTKQDHPEA